MRYTLFFDTVRSCGLLWFSVHYCLYNHISLCKTLSKSKVKWRKTSEVKIIFDTAPYLCFIIVCVITFKSKCIMGENL